MSSHITAYKKMYLIREAEGQLVDLYLKEKIMSFVHFCIGEEAVAVGVCDALEKEDRVYGNHRSHGHFLAKGGNLKAMIAELLGKETGITHGKGGSMHMIDKSVNFNGSTPILGSVIPIACGSAFEQKYKAKSSVSVAFFGDGASEEGVFYETLNLAALFKLPLLLVIENNLYSVNSKLNERRSDKYDVEKIVTGLGGVYVKVDGNDYLSVLDSAKFLVEGVRALGGPAVLECVTYRHMAHSAPIFDENYRGEDVFEKRVEADPLKRMRLNLLDNGTKEAEIKDVEESVKKEVSEAIQFAKDSQYPDKKELFNDLYV